MTGLRRTQTELRPAMTARTIVWMGVFSLFMVLLATITVGVGSAFFAGIGLLFATMIVIILFLQRRGSSFRP